MKKSKLLDREILLATYRRNLKLYETTGQDERAEIQRRLIKRLEADK